MSEQKLQKATKLIFEKHYEDNSGVRAAVRYDSTRDDREIEIMSISEDWAANLPVSDLDWLIDCLQRVQSEI